MVISEVPPAGTVGAEVMTVLVRRSTHTLTSQVLATQCMDPSLKLNQLVLVMLQTWVEV